MNKFIDIEAREEREREEDEWDENEPDFLDDEEEEESGEVGVRFEVISSYHRSLASTKTNTSQPAAIDTEREAEPLGEPFNHQRDDGGDPIAAYVRRYHYEEHELASDMTVPTLWLVKCIKGEEANIIMTMYQKYMQEDTAPLLSAFSLPDISGYIFIEGRWDNMPGPWVTELSNIRGVRGAMYPNNFNLRRIPRSDALFLLKMCLRPEPFRPGVWVRLRFAKYKGRRRLYHGDLAVVDRIEGGKAIVVLVPQIPRSGFEDKPAEEFTRRLWDREVLNREYRNKMLKRNSFERGLWVREISKRNIRPVEDHHVTQEEFLLFALSMHPTVVENFPRVREWVFEEGERVAKWWNRNVVGTVTAVTESGLLVHTEDGSQHEWGWAGFKVWNAIDWVVAPDGYAGIVVEVEGAGVKIWDLKTYDSYGVEPSPIVNSYHANTLRNGMPPIEHQTEAETRGGPTRRQNPWKGAYVRVTRGPAKGLHTVIDTIPNSNTRSTLKVVVQCCIINNRAIRTVDYDDVVLDATGSPLHKSNHSREWFHRFPQGYVHPHELTPSLKPIVTETQTLIVAREQESERQGTPMPVTTERHPSQAWLWDLNTIGLKFQVTVVEGRKSFKAILEVERAGEDEHLETRKVSYHRYRHQHHLHYPIEIKPKTPSRNIHKPFFVIKGEHRGKTLARLKCDGTTLRCAEVNVLEGVVVPALWSVEIDECCVLTVDGDSWLNLERELDPLRDEAA